LQRYDGSAGANLIIFGPTCARDTGASGEGRCNWLANRLVSPTARLPPPLLPGRPKANRPSGTTAANCGLSWAGAIRRAVIEAVRGGWIPIEEACELYSISVDEFLAWERDMDRYGVHGLRTTRYQIYRKAEETHLVSRT